MLLLIENMFKFFYQRSLVCQFHLSWSLGSVFVNSDQIFTFIFCLQMMERMYKRCQLVHADLSEYNMLWFNHEVWFIDVSQSVKPFHPEGLKFLLRDCTNVSNVSVIGRR